MDKPIVLVLILVTVAVPIFSGCLEEEEKNHVPSVEIISPENGSVVSNIVTISGTASDPDGDDTILKVEVKINGSEWKKAKGTIKWSYDWITYEIEDLDYPVKVRCWDGIDYSSIATINVTVDNPDPKETGEHKWGIFIAAGNFPQDNESKLGNGLLFFAEDMAEYLIQKCDYSESNIFIFFDDGNFRKDNGFGKIDKTLQERKSKYDFNYGGATLKNVETSIEYIVKQANKFQDSEIFIWLAGHGHGDNSDPYFGGKVLENSAVYLWDDTITDDEFGDLLSGLTSKKTCIIVDACYSGGYAEKTIYGIPTFFLLRSGIPDPGRVVITGTSKFHVGYASLSLGPLFSRLWFEGLTSGDADGFRPGIFSIGRPTIFQIFKDGKISVEEAFYYARYKLKTDKLLEDFSKMEPQINDQYPYRGFLRSFKGLFLGE
jgi:hypothetical protein